ncbi:serine O-acetyltransferase [Planktothrix sp. PCC 11201]|uniref:serine O-acetyltransferase n=1 Tax=Planktothrix sp. PCC 11201 TaxID=1729650 RepID=UPI001F42D920|nr:serine O-acetyltransferase [Planktothrix sp. PCC 11201]
MTDLQTIYQRDPAARNWLEVLFCYPGLQAIWWHRIAHRLHRWGVPFLPRFLSQLSRWFTGIEIHPGAKMGKGVFIDHGMGVVIGETAIVGDYALIYQGVTLGGTGKEKGKRHPTLGDHVMVGAGAKLLGNLYIGDHVRIGAGSVVLRDVPSHCTVVGIPGRITRNAKETEDLQLSDRLPDPEAMVIRNLFERIKILEQELSSLKALSPIAEIDNSQEEDEAIASFDINEVIEEFLNGAGI